MRNVLLGAASALALLMGGMIPPAGAAILDPGAMRPAIDAVNPVEKAACWRWGWHGWGWYPCGYPYYHRPWRPYWGWGPGWRWHHHRHWW